MDEDSIKVGDIIIGTGDTMEMVCSVKDNMIYTFDDNTYNTNDVIKVKPNLNKTRPTPNI